MRPLKFRIWIKSAGRYFYENNSLLHTMLDMPEYYKDDAIEQFTGLTDINGKDIYEGDIVRTGDCITFIYYSGGKFDEALLPCSDFDDPILLDSDILEMAPFMTIIGNIHDNPELLEK